MNILFLSQIVPYPPHGGVLQRGFNIIREIGKRNKVFLLAFIHPDVLRNETAIEDSRRALKEHCIHVEYVDLWAKRSSIHKYAGYLWSGLSNLPFSVLAHRSDAFGAAMARILENERIDLVHYDTIALAQFRNSRSGYPNVLTHHNIESQLMERRSEKEKSILARIYTGSQAKKIKFYERHQCPKYDLNITVSDADANHLQSMLPGIKTATVPNGVDTDYFRPDQANTLTERAIIYTGGMNMYANRDAVSYFLSSIWKKIKSELPDVRFYVVGQDPPEELRRIAEADKSIIITGYVDDIRPYVSRSAAYVVPLRVGGGTRLKILDAMAMGKAIVSTTIGAEGILATEGKNILLADEPAKFASKTIEMLTIPKKREILGAEARKLVEQQYSWGIIGNSLQYAYEQVLEEKKEGR